MKTTTETKVCKECGRELPLEQFSRNPHGYTSLCKDCMKAKQSKGVKAARMREVITADLPPEIFADLHKPEYQPEGKKAPSAEVVLAGYSDEELAAELQRRGYTGTLTKAHTITL